MSIPYRYGTTIEAKLSHQRITMCQFLIGMVRHVSEDVLVFDIGGVSIPYRYGTTYDRKFLPDGVRRVSIPYRYGTTQ